MATGAEAESEARTDGGGELLRFVEALSRAGTFGELARRFSGGFAPLFDVPMHGLYALAPWTGRREMVTAANVSDAFLARYERHGREVDSLTDHLIATERPAYNLGLMSMDEWLAHPLYRQVKRLHDVRHEVQVPVVTRDGLVGTVHFGTSDAQRAFTPYELQLAATVGRVVSATIERLHYAERREREFERMRAALQLTGTAMVTIDPGSPEPLLNETARRLLDEVVDGTARLAAFLGHAGRDGSVTRHVEVRLADGGTGVLCAHVSDAAGVMVLELQRDGREVDERTLAALTPREREVALRVIEGWTDQEIAARLCLSRHTVRQHVKRIYRKVDVDSRVALTRVLLRAGPGADRPGHRTGVG